MSLTKIIKDIQSLKIQGAKNVALAAIDAIELITKDQSIKTKVQLLSKIKKTKQLLENSRPTEPSMRNSLFIITKGLDGNKNEIIKTVVFNIKKVRDYFKNSEKTIIEIASRKIKDGMNIFTHCHSSTVTKILINAKKQGKKFEVYNTETRPLFQGRITAKELAKAGIIVNHFVDSGARIALKQCDLFFCGADAITSEGKVINKIGTELFMESAKRLGVSTYVCTHALKYDSKTERGFEEVIEKRFSKEVWNTKIKNIKISNFAFEQIDPELITGIISELGIFKPSVFVEEARKNYLLY